MTSVALAFGTGSGLDVQRIVADLTAAEREPRAKQLAERQVRVEARISAAGQLRSGLDGLVGALATRLSDPARPEPDARSATALVDDLVGALNELFRLGRTLTRGGGLGEPAGALAGDRAARRALADLATLPTREAGPAGALRLADVGVSTTREGELRLDRARLAAADPAAVEGLVRALVAQPARFGEPAGPLRAARDAFAAATQGAPGRPTAFQREQAEIRQQQAALDARTARFREQLTRQFAALDRAVGASRATGAFLDQQVRVWTNADRR